MHISFGVVMCCSARYIVASREREHHAVHASGAAQKAVFLIACVPYTHPTKPPGFWGLHNSDLMGNLRVALVNRLHWWIAGCTDTQAIEHVFRCCSYKLLFLYMFKCCSYSFKDVVLLSWGQAQMNM
jgi:hypothetical protein